MSNKIWRSCPDCGVEESKLHLKHCDWERCSCCGKQVLAWGRCKGTKPEPFFNTIGYHCERCKEYMPKMKMVPKEKWKFICGGTYPLDCVLCITCMDKIEKWRERND